jgi:hypothetical protein
MSRTLTSFELVDYPQSTNATPVKHPHSAHTTSNGSQPAAEDLQPTDVAVTEQLVEPGKGTTVIVLTTVVSITMISSMLAGVTTISLPTMARELQLAPSVLLW